MSDFLFSTSQLYLSESQHLESYIEDVLINPNKDVLTHLIAVSTVIIFLIILVKLYLNGNDNFWPDRGVKLVETSEFFSILDQLRGSKGRRDWDIGVYRKFTGKKFVGLMEGRRPVFFVKDGHLAERILMEDFDYFVNRRKFLLDKTNLVIMKMLNEVTGLEWEKMRTGEATVLATTTTTVEERLGRKLFSQFNSSGEQLVERVRRESAKLGNHTDGISVTECFGRFTMDVIATACLGVKSSCLNEKELPFYKHRKMFQSLGPWRMAKVFNAFLFSRVAALFRISFIEQESADFLKNIVKHTINHRKNNEKECGTAATAAEGEKNGGSPRHDFLQLLLDTRDKEMKIDEAELKHSLMTGATPSPSPPKIEDGCTCCSSSNNNEKNTTTTTNAISSPNTSPTNTIIAANATIITAFSSQAFLSDDNDGRSNAGNKVNLTDELIPAQSILFLLAEFEKTASILLSFATYALAVHPGCQEKLYAEIEQCLQKSIGKDKAALDYDSVNSLEYMDMFINETLRMFPPSSRVELRCTKEYRVDDADTNLIQLPRETLLVIPIIAFHYDEQYFPDPDKFSAERFSPENRSKTQPCCFIPLGFGHGPRNRNFCTGIKLGTPPTDVYYISRSIEKAVARCGITTIPAVVGAKTALAHLVHNFIIEPTSCTPIPMEYDNFSPLLKPVRMMKIRFRPRK